ncbi:hypothetical protein BE20_07155 [Sorangium cellulosum]|uniref:CHAT domain-containing protein n=1 Tax=Sorangium cellulosum TaxID=56 RepID=A0A150RA54_SORCE|nr:hypothetical protein BE18_36460 [Sorangium cellulosum]KYF94194.1 hypothetical protein BE20_07155 [Sorangium cellulosum]
MNAPDVDEMIGAWTDLPLDKRLDMARAIIDRYDADFDALNRRSIALGALDMFLAGVDRNTADGEELAILVGQAWCRMVDSDIEYDLLRGVDLIERSRSITERLLKQHQDSSAWSSFATYVLARWHDAAGRINFRCGDMQSAAKCFKLAVELAKDRHNRCFGDLASNLRRAEHDAAKQVGDRVNDDDLRRKFEELLFSYEAATQAPPVGLNLDALRKEVDSCASVWWRDRCSPVDFPPRPCRAAGDHETRERLRGLSNIEHNLSIVLKSLGQDLLAESRLHSERSALYAYSIADGYRFAQALRHMADMADGQDPIREAMCKRIDKLPWPRGRLMAKQQLGRYLAATGKRDQAQALLDELLKFLSRQQQERGGDLGVDIELLRFTAKNYRDAGAPIERAETHELKAARSMRRVIKAALYRRRFKIDVLPLFTRAIERRINPLLSSGDDSSARQQLLDRSEAVEELLGLVEEMTARELLDLLATRGPAASNDVRSDEPEALPISPAADEPNGAATRDGLRDDASARMKLIECVQFDRERFEREEFQRAATTGEIDPEVTQAVRRLSAQLNGPTIVRYFTYDVGAGETRIAVVVIRGGMIQAFRPIVDAHRGPITLDELQKRPVGRSPTRGDATWLWYTFFAPIWNAVKGDGAVAQLVIVPAPGMFALPLHIALVPRSEWPREPHPELTNLKDAPLCAVTPLCFTVSTTAFVTRQRHLLRTQPFDPGDDLCALVPRYRDASRRFWPGELADLSWRPERFHVAGRAIDGAPCKPARAGDRGGLNYLLTKRAEVFVFAGHGSSIKIDGIDAEVALELDESDHGPEFLTQYALLSGARLRHNKWTLLNACVSGTAADEAARAEVSGFLKSFIAAGAGALTVTLWPVYNDAIVQVAGELLREAARAAVNGSSVDIVTRLREIQCCAYRVWHERTTGANRLSSERPIESAHTDCTGNALHACPMVLYL